jgi:predicted RNase H-like nuclease
MNVIGLDGYKNGWVGIRLQGGVFAEALIAPTLEDVLKQHPSVDVLAIDMPIGLVDRGWRTCDHAARELLGPRRSSVFPIPPRPSVEEGDYVRSKAICRELNDKMFSKQAFALFPKIREVNELAERDGRVYEVHPEVTFQVMAGGTHLAASKKNWTGIAERSELLRLHGIEVPPSATILDRVPADDVLDAAAAAWSAHRIATASADSVPARPTQFREGGAPIVIWA